MEKYAITVIVPIYQVEQYLRECLQSIVESTIFGLCEVLLVDDGSKDGSVDIALSYVERYGNCFLLRKKNGGAGSARNLGIQKAHGKYLYFVDGDDFISRERLDNLLNRAESRQCDMVLASYQEYREADGKTIETCRDYLITPKPVTGKNMIDLRMDHSDWINQSVTVLVRRNMLISHSVYFPVEDVLYEDIIWMNKCLFQAERVSYVPDCGYFYRKRPGSAVSHLDGIRKKDLTDSVKCLADFKYWYDGAEEKDKRLIGRLALRMVTMTVEYMRGIEKKERQLYYREMKEMEWGGAFKKSANTRMEYMKAFLYSLGIPVFAAGMRLYKGMSDGTDQHNCTGI